MFSKGSIIWQMAELWTYYPSGTQVLLRLTNSGYGLGSILSLLCHLFLKEPHKISKIELKRKVDNKGIATFKTREKSYLCFATSDQGSHEGNVTS